MNRFNLSFKGEIQPGQDPRQVKARFGKLFGIDDPARLERFFTGDTIILRRNLERKTAAEYYSKLRKLGVEAELIKVTAAEAAAAFSPAPNRTADQDKRQSTAAAVDEAARLATWEKARREAESEATRRRAEEEARRKAEEEARRKAEEEAARRRAEEQEVRRIAEEEAAKRRAEEEARRKAEEEARRKAEEEARRKAEEEARRKAEEEARRKAEEEARRKAEEEARRKAEEKARKAEEAARRKALQEEQKQKAAEKAAREKAEREAAKRKAREEAAQRRQEERARKAEEAAKREAEREQARLRAAEAAAKRAAEKAEQERIKAEEVARRKAAEAERRRAAREEAERRRAEAAKRAEAEKARIRAEREATARQEKAAREQARREQAAAEAAARAREEAARSEREAHRKAMEEQAISRAAKELSRQPSLKPAATGVKTTLELPQAGKTVTTGRRKRQVGAPNLFALRPFRNTEAVQARVAVARRAAQRYLAIAGISLALALAGVLIYLGRPAAPPLSGPAAAAVPPGQGPVLLAGDRLLMHDRAGVVTRQLDIAELGVGRLSDEMVFTDSGDLLLLGDLVGQQGQAPPGTTLLRCRLEASECAAVPGVRDGPSVRTFTIHPLDGSLFLLDGEENALVRIDTQGEVSARAELDIPVQPVLRLHAGLLFMNSIAGPAISVFRYDDGAFGKQLDEILLLPPPALEAGQQVVTDFLWNAGSWWVTMGNADTGSRGVYRFDGDWNYLGQLALAAGTHPEQLLAWGEKTLVRDSGQLQLQRFNAAGDAEAPMASRELVEMVDRGRRMQHLFDIGWRGALLAAGAATLGALALGWLHATRALVYRGRKASGAQPIDDLAEDISWITPDSRRQDVYRRLNIGFALLATALVLAAVGAGISATQLAAVLLTIGGAAVALLLLQRSPLGHIGLVDGQLLLVDHSNLYHLGSDARLQHRGPFLFLDDVAVFTGNAALPAFSRQAIEKRVSPLLEGGIRVDRKTAMVKLLQARHPLTRAAAWALAGCLLAILVLSLS